jgi:hypothetical protein
MKKFITIPFVITVLLGIILSCKKSELEFSCDPFINKFVKENRAKLSLLTPDELAVYDIKLQRAIFNSWDYQRKREAWIYKLQQVQVNVTFTSAETIHIQKLMDHINEDYFLDKDIQEKSVIRSEFAEELFNSATNELCWTKQFIAFMVYRLYTDPSEFEAELSGLKSLKYTATTDSEAGNCGCSTSSDYCGYANCYSRDCTVTLSGCGWLWSMPCDGLCY